MHADFGGHLVGGAPSSLYFWINFSEPLLSGPIDPTAEHAGHIRVSLDGNNYNEDSLNVSGQRLVLFLFADTSVFEIWSADGQAFRIQVEESLSDKTDELRADLITSAQEKIQMAVSNETTFGHADFRS